MVILLQIANSILVVFAILFCIFLFLCEAMPAEERPEKRKKTKKGFLWTLVLCGICFVGSTLTSQVLIKYYETYPPIMEIFQRIFLR